MSMEINLIGRTVDEATEELEKYLDRAFLAGLFACASFTATVPAFFVAASANS